MSTNNRSLISRVSPKLKMLVSCSLVIFLYWSGLSLFTAKAKSDLVLENGIRALALVIDRAILIDSNHQNVQTDCNKRYEDDLLPRPFCSEGAILRKDICECTVVYIAHMQTGTDKFLSLLRVIYPFFKDDVSHYAIYVPYSLSQNSKVVAKISEAIANYHKYLYLGDNDTRNNVIDKRISNHLCSIFFEMKDSIDIVTSKSGVMHGDYESFIMIETVHFE